MAGTAASGTGAANSEAGKTANEQTQAGQPNTGGDSSSSSSSSSEAGKTGGESGKTDEQAAAAAATEQSKAGDQGDNKGGKAGDSKETPKAPDKYQLTVPEESKAFVDAATLKHFEGVARTAGMTNDEAQAFLEDQLEFTGKQAAQWLEETTKDPDYGGEKLAETQRLAKLAVDRIRPEGHPRRAEFLSFLARGGAGNHIQAVSFLADLGRMMGEDRPPQGKGGAGGGQTGSSNEQKASILYDHPTSKAAAG